MRLSKYVVQSTVCRREISMLGRPTLNFERYKKCSKEIEIASRKLKSRISKIKLIKIESGTNANCNLLRVSFLFMKVWTHLTFLPVRGQKSSKSH